MADDIETIRTAIAAKFATLLDEFNSVNERIAELQVAQKELVVKGHDCRAAARLFGFDLDAETAKYREGMLPPAKSPEQTLASVLAGTSTVMGSGAVISQNPVMRTTIKDSAIEMARDAYPEPIRASALRKQLEDRGIKSHWKTAGMTLNRLVQEGILRREGRNWFFVPENERQISVPDQEEEGPGDEPGLFLDAAE